MHPRVQYHVMYVKEIYMPNLIKLPRLSCTNCEYSWVPRISDVRRCPNCGVATWDRPRNRSKRETWNGGQG